MKEIKAKKDFSLNGVFYLENDIIEGLTIEQIARLNEKGFIVPLTQKDLILIERELKKPKKEEKVNDTK